MDADQIQAEMDLFHELLEQPEEQREAFISARCGDVPDLVERLRKLLEGHERAEAAVATQGIAGQAAEQVPADIDSFRIIEKLGEGGMGVVYVAEQTQPVRRRVAIKLVKSGVDSAEVIARFHAERQALALMNHKNIAQILDAGVFEGRPYFVMELIDGAPITEYCDRRALPIADRLRLFIEVCQGVQHAHQKGVIHRDLKPPNVLVAEEDGVPSPKIIDFGIAKAVEHRLTEHTMVTQFGQLIGTPAYMSPEQTGANALDIDTRCDVYSLGALLYELLTGKTPLDFKTLDTMPLDEVMRIIREEEPMKPSSRLIKPGEAKSTVAIRLGTESRKLGTVLRGELDWIVMKSLEKERDRRYESASDLAHDIERHLAHQPVLAGPPSGTYRASKFVRRHKRMIAAIALIVSALVAGTAVSTNQYFHAKSERIRADRLRMEAVAAEQEQAHAREEAELARAEATKRAEELEQVARFQEEQLAGIDVPLMAVRLRRGVLENARAVVEHAGKEMVDARAAQLEKLLAGVDFTGLTLNLLDENVFERTVDTINEQFETQPLVRARLQQAMAETVRELGLLERAIEPQETAVAIRREILGDDHPDTLASIENMGVLLHMQGKLDEAMPYTRESLENRRRVLGDEHPDTLNSITNMGVLLRWQGKLDEAEPYYRESLEGRRRILGNAHPDTLISIENMAVLLLAQGKLDEAMQYSRESLEGRRRLLGNNHPGTLNSVSNIGVLLRRHGKLDEAEPYYREALDGRRRVLGDDHPDTLTSIENMAILLLVQGKLDEAMPYLRESLEGNRRVLGDEHLDTLDSINSMGVLLRKQGRMDEAELYYREALEGRRRLLGNDHPGTLSSIGNMGVLLRAQGKLDEAEPYYREALEGRRRVLGNEHVGTLHSVNNMGALLVAQGKLDEAEPYYREALEGGRRTLANDHPDTLVWIDSMGALLMAQGKLDEAMPYLRESLEGNRRVLGDEHQDTLVSINNMGTLLNRMGRHDEALEVLLAGEAAARRVLIGSNASRFGIFLSELGEALTAQGAFAQAEVTLLEAHRLLAAGFGGDHRPTTKTIERIISLYDFWHAADPGEDHDAKVAEWRVKLPAH